MRLSTASSFVCSLVLAVSIFGSPIVVSDVNQIILLKSEDECGPNYCAGTNDTHDNPHLCGDSRLGPKRLPTQLPLAAQVYAYSRLGGLCPSAFLQKWYNSYSRSYNYPPQFGFQLTTSGNPIAGNQTLPIGMRVDRFGSEYGNFLSPAGSPFSQRALPPSSLDTPSGDLQYPYNYHIYEVITPFDVLSGPVAGWFGQPGQGTQYMTYSKIMTLISGGFLERVNLTATY